MLVLMLQIYLRAKSCNRVTTAARSGVVALDIILVHVCHLCHLGDTCNESGHQDARVLDHT